VYNVFAYVFGDIAYVGNKKSLSRKLDTMKITICIVMLLLRCGSRGKTLTNGRRGCMSRALSCELRMY
jgi:hypothetical protein